MQFKLNMAAQSREFTVHGILALVMDHKNRMVSAGFVLEEVLEKGVAVTGFNTHPELECFQENELAGEVVTIIGKLIHIPEASIGTMSYEKYNDLVRQRCNKLRFDIDLMVEA